MINLFSSLLKSRGDFEINQAELSFIHFQD